MTALRLLYTATTGFALTQGGRSFFVRENAMQPATIEFRPGIPFIVFLIFITTVVRFAHGAMRHFDRTYVETTESAHAWHPLVDFAGLFGEATLFVLLAFSLDHTFQFAVLLLLLIALDSVWLPFVHHAATARHGRPYGNWVATNSLFLAAIPIMKFWGDHDRVLIPSIAAIVGFHTILDYAAPGQWEFYFPGSTPPPEIVHFARRIQEPWTRMTRWLDDYVTFAADVVILFAAVLVRAIGVVSLVALALVLFSYGVLARLAELTGLRIIWKGSRFVVRFLRHKAAQERKSSLKGVVFVAGPYIGANYDQIEGHIRAAEKAAITLWNAGFGVFTPHLNTAHFEEKAKATEPLYKEFDLRMLESADAVLAIDGWRDSRGASAEVERARLLGKPVFYSAYDLIADLDE